ncbi:MAG: glycosyltransferase [Pseudomonadota bacterium]
MPKDTSSHLDASNPETVADCFAVQDVALPFPDMPAALYFHGPITQTPDVTGIILTAGQHLSGRTYFNTFYLHYWRSYTSMNRVGLHLHLSGRIRLALIGTDAAGANETLAQVELTSTDAAQSHVAWALDVGPEFQVSRVHLEITALDDSAITGLRFVTDTPPPRQVSLSIGLVTFNREDNLAVTLQSVIALKQANPAVRRIHLVNQGRDFTHPDVIAALPDLSLVQQANLGGCGGFTRTMVETLASPERTTHHLLMDDDIILDAGVITRSLQFLSYADSPVAIGGQMMNLDRRAILFEAGANLGPFWLVHPTGRDLDLTDPDALRLFDVTHDIDYNAWWFCMVPTDAMESVGLPPPFFLHGDDIEYGCRLKQHGTPTVSLPGVGVWHESFRYKHSDIILYYDLRNLLVNSAIHPAVTKAPDTLFVLGWIMNYVLVHRYRTARACLMALHDFLDGPEAAFGADGLSRHEALAATLARENAPPQLKGLNAANYKTPAFVVRSLTIRETIIQYVTLFVRLALFPPRSQQPVLFYGDVHPGLVGTKTYLLATKPEADECLLLEPSRFALLRLTGQALAASLRYLLGHRKARANWAARLPDWQTRDAWETQFTRPRR